MEDDRVGNKKLLVGWNNKRYRDIYRRMQFVLENEK